MAFFDRDSSVIFGLKHPQRDSLSPNTVRLQMAVLLFIWPYRVLRSLKNFQRGGQQGGLPLPPPPRKERALGLLAPNPRCSPQGRLGGNMKSATPTPPMFFLRGNCLRLSTPRPLLRKHQPPEQPVSMLH